MTKIDFGVFIGRFQPFHNGHLAVIEEALTKVNHLIILIGSPNKARDPRDPFTFEERFAMIDSALTEKGIDGTKVTAFALPDEKYANTTWATNVRKIVNQQVLRIGNGNGPQNHGLNDFTVALAGYGKDHSSYYLNMFPEWMNIQAGASHEDISGEEIRHHFFEYQEIVSKNVPEATADFMRKFWDNNPDYHMLCAEFDYYKAYPKVWGPGPHLTVDAVCIQAGHVLLVTRGEKPGRGLLALPGGFIDKGETLEDATIRELREETKISDHKGELPPAMVRSFIDRKATRVFDDPYRSLRGRVITQAMLFRFPQSTNLLDVTGADDAMHAEWYRLSDLKPEMLFEDHWHILQRMLN